MSTNEVLVLAEVRRAWPPDPENALVLDTIEETLAINQFFLTGRNWESNERRARWNRRSFLRHWEPRGVSWKAGRTLGRGLAPAGRSSDVDLRCVDDGPAVAGRVRYERSGGG